jgi:hypothetical protein
MSLFSDLSILTMLHGIGLGGGAMLALFGALVLIYARYGVQSGAQLAPGSRLVGLLTMASAGLLWLTVLVGTYVVFPPYRVTPPKGASDLSTYPRSWLLSDPSTAWLHSFAMETKEHVPWIAAMLATAAAFVVTRHGARLWVDRSAQRAVMSWLGISLALVSAAALLGTFVNKVAPVQ